MDFIAQETIKRPGGGRFGGVQYHLEADGDPSRAFRHPDRLLQAAAAARSAVCRLHSPRRDVLLRAGRDQVAGCSILDLPSHAIHYDKVRDDTSVTPKPCGIPVRTR